MQKGKGLLVTKVYWIQYKDFAEIAILAKTHKGDMTYTRKGVILSCNLIHNQIGNANYILACSGYYSNGELVSK